MEKAYEVVQDTAGNVISGASVSIYNADTGALATIYEDNETTVKSQPFTSNSKGGVTFKAANGNYRIDATSGGETYSINRSLFDHEDSPFGQIVNTVATLRGIAPVAARKIWLAYHTTAGDGGHGMFRAVTGAAPGTYVDNGGTIIVPTGGDGSAAWLRENETIVDARVFGVFGAAADYTAELQVALDFANANGIREVILPDGTIYLSLANSVHANACLLIPANIHLRGQGMGVTTIQRLPAERGTNGVLMVNKNYDLNGGYTADGDIYLSDFTITDGATTPARTYGDLIGIGHAEHVRIWNVEGLNHDQHFVDICGSKDVRVWNCKSANAVTATASATYQIDKAGSSVAIWGILNDSTSCQDIEIDHNKILESHADNIIHFHSGVYAKDVRIHHNWIDATALGSGQQAIGGDTDISYDNVRIYENTIETNNINARMINLPSADTVTAVKGLKIYRNKLRGKARIAIYVGDESPTLTDYGPLEDVEIYENDIEMDCRDVASNVLKLIATAMFKSARIHHNKIRLYINGQTQQTEAILDTWNKSCTIDHNEIELLDSYAGTTLMLRAIQSKSDFVVMNGLSRTLSITHNEVRGGNWRHQVSVAEVSGITSAHLKGVISGNQLRGTNYAGGYTIFEAIPLSDGTNNLTWVDFGVSGDATDSSVLPLTSSLYVTGLALPGTKAGGGTSSQKLSRASFELHYAPLSIDQFDEDEEDMHFAYISATDVAGTQVVDVHQVLGTFAVVTGGSGVSCVINNATFQPVLRTSGYLRVRAGI